MEDHSNVNFDPRINRAGGFKTLIAFIFLGLAQMACADGPIKVKTGTYDSTEQFDGGYREPNTCDYTLYYRDDSAPNGVRIEERINSNDGCPQDSGSLISCTTVACR